MATIFMVQPMLATASSELSAKMKKVRKNCLGGLTSAIVLIVAGGVSLNPHVAPYMFNVAAHGSSFWIGVMVSCISYR